MNNDLFINGHWLKGEGPAFEKRDPSYDETLANINSASQSQATAALDAAGTAFPAWAALSVEKRLEFLQAYVQELETHKDELAACIASETGKPLWEAKTEAGAMAGKFGISREAHELRRAPGETPKGTGKAVSRYKPLGPVVVLGPFNFPGHLPGGQILPALIAGNTVVFKPSEKTPLTGRMMAEFMERAGLPSGVFNLVQGGPESARALIEHRKLRALLFTGSFAVGRILHQALAGRPEVLLVLEMGGNNPLVVWEPDNLRAAALAVLESAFVTAGQRCSCARRLILPQGAAGDELLGELDVFLEAMGVGLYGDEPEPFMGTVISPEAAQSLLRGWQSLGAAGGEVIRELKLSTRSQALLLPGIMDVTGVRERSDDELFGPLLQVYRVPNFEAAIDVANDTEFGLSAGLLSARADLFQKFYKEVDAGVVNWNQKITGADSRLPFGGLGRSGNFRPGAFFAADYCSEPVASLENESLIMPENLPPGIILK